LLRRALERVERRRSFTWPEKLFGSKGHFQKSRAGRFCGKGKVSIRAGTTPAWKKKGIQKTTTRERNGEEGIAINALPTTSSIKKNKILCSQNGKRS